MSSRDSVAAPPAERVPFAPGFLTDDLTDLEQVRLVGSRCADCGVTLLGLRRRCENCAGRNVPAETFEPTGTVWSFTIQRYQPPGMSAVVGDWVPRPVAWIDLDADGPRIIGVVEAAADDMAIGMRVRLVVTAGTKDAEGRETVDYSFVPAGEQS